MADVRRLMKMLPGRERAKVIGLVENMAYLSWIDSDEPICPWGSPYDVVNLAAGFYYPILGKIPMTLNNQPEPRIQAITDTVLLAVERALDGRMYLEVDLVVVTRRADYMIKRYGGKSERGTHLETINMRQIWTHDNLAGWLAGAITEQGAILLINGIEKRCCVSYTGYGLRLEILPWKLFLMVYGGQR